MDKPPKVPCVYLIGGPNGAGKTTFANRFALYIPLADDWVIYDNSGVEPVAVAHGGEGGVCIENRSLYEAIERMGKP